MKSQAAERHNTRAISSIAGHARGQSYRRARIATFAAAVVTVAVFTAGCGTQTIVRTVNAANRAGSRSATATTGGGGSSSGAGQTAKLGSTITLSGNDGESMAVTVDQVMDPLTVGPDDQADSGQRYVGVQITLKNMGSVPYSDSPSNGSTLLSNTNEQAQTALVTGGPCGNDFASSANIAPGGTQQGCIPFEMQTGQTPGSFLFSLNSGFADQTGQWSLPGATAGNTGPGNAVAASPPASATSCGGGLSVGPDTSCPFAKNVQTGYDSNHAGTENVYSPVTNQSYTMTCTKSASLVTCTGGNNAAVYFSG